MLQTKTPCLLPALLGVLAGALHLYGQGTAFTYQGQLLDKGQPAHGSYDLTFTAFKASTGNSVEGALTNTGVAVSNGLFTTMLDFGGVPDGRLFWLELGVRSNGVGSFTTVSPRQAVTPTPYALFANTASNLVGRLPVGQLIGPLGLAQLPAEVVTNAASGVNLTGTFIGNASGLSALNAAQLTGTVADARLSSNVAWRAGGNAFSGDQTISGNVGFSDPATSLTFPATGGANTPMIQMFASGTKNADRMVIAHSGALSNWGLQYQNASHQFNFLGQGKSAMTVLLQSGRAGIGKTNPATALDVAGTVTATAFAGNGAGLTNLPASAVAAAPPGMVLIPGGAFTMGDSLDGESDASPTNVTVAAFYMDVNLVSLSQWQSVYFWATDHGYEFFTNITGGGYQASGKTANHPVQTVNWWDCVKWCNARSQQAGKPAVYYTDAGWTTVYMTGEPATLYPHWAAGGYRLPTEAEWEKAARGGLSGQRFPWGNVINQNLANYQGNSGSAYDLGPNSINPAFTNGGFPYTSPVGSFAANGYGLNDMAGNVWEWCWDWYGPYAGGADPRGPTTGSGRVLRGGSWFLNAIYCRAAYRNNYGAPFYSGNDVGFRAVLPPGQ